MVPLPEYESTPDEVRRFALIQLTLTSAFVALLFIAFGGVEGDLPPWWVIALLLATVAASAVLSERVWLHAEPLDPAGDDLPQTAVGVFAAQTVRKLMICEAPIVLAVLVTFIGSWAAWPILLGAVPGVLVLAVETWPSVRNISMSAAMLESQGAQSGLVESFRTW